MANNFLPFLTMVMVQVGFAVMNILSKLAMDSGMNPFIHVAYRQVFATIVIAPFAYFSERKTRPRMSKYIFFQIFLSSLFGATFNQIFYFVGLQHSTPTIACALSNLLPALTFLLAVPVGLESIGIRRRPGQAKVLGTIACVGGAMFLSFYNGPVIIEDSGIHWMNLDNLKHGNSRTHSSVFLGPFLVIASTISWAVWFVIQAKMSETYPAPYTISALICFMASFECGIIGLAFDNHASAWYFTPHIRAISSIYSGVVCTALSFCAMLWCIQKKGPLYVSVFSPFLLIVVAALSWALLGEKIYLGTAIGSTFIVLGLYAVLWGKNREMNTINTADDREGENKQAIKEMEIHFTELENGNTYSLEVQFSEVPNGSH